MTANKINQILICFLTFSLVASLGYSFFYRIVPVVDAQAYDQIAVNLIEGFGFKEDRNKSFEFDTAIVRAGPGYEFFLAGIYKIFGHHYEAVWIIQALLHALSAYLLFLICRRLFRESGEKIGLIAAALFGLHPDLIEISAMLMTETLYLFLIILAVWLFVKVYQEPRRLSRNVFLALALAAAILSRPPIILFVPIILLFYFLRRHYQPAVVFLVVLVLVLAPWTIRNYRIYHQFIPTTLIGEYNFWVGNTLTANGGQISGGFNPATDHVEKYGFFSFKRAAKEHFKNFVWQEPLIFIKLTILRVIRYFSLIRPMGFWFYQSGLGQLVFVASSLIATATLFVSGFSGLVLDWKQNALFKYLAFFALSAPLVLLPTVVESRYRFQIYPFLAVFGAYFLNALAKKNPSAFKALSKAGVFLLLISLLDILIFWETVVERLGRLWHY